MARLRLHSVLVIVLVIAGVTLLTPLLPSQDLNFTYTAPVGSIPYDVQTGEGSDTLGLLITEDSANPGFPHNVGGWSMGVALDGSLLAATDIEQGSYLETINGGSGPDFFAPAMYDDGFTVGCVYSFTGMAVCTYEVPKEAVAVTYATNSSTLLGDDNGASTPVEWADTIGTPPVINSMVLQAGNQGVVFFEDGLIDLVPTAGWSRGDCNEDGRLNIADGIWILDALFEGGELGSCMSACDVDGDANVGQTDAVYSFHYLFSGGPPPPAPFPECGDTPGSDCESYTACP